MLSKKYIAYKTNSLIKKDKLQRKSMSYGEVKSIGILFTTGSREKHNEIKNLIKKFTNDKKQVTTLTYLKKNQENHEFLFDYFTDKEVSFWGNIESDKVLEFIKKPFDYLFYLDNESELILRHLMTKCNAQFRVAKNDVNNVNISEMMVEIPNKNDIKSLIEEMYRYAKKLS